MPLGERITIEGLQANETYIFAIAGVFGPQLVLSCAHCEAGCSFCSLMRQLFCIDVIVKVLVAALSQPMSCTKSNDKMLC